MATLDALKSDPLVDVPHLVTRSRHLGLLQIAQVGSGLLGQALLLTRWSPHIHTDLFLLLSSIPWLITAFILVGGLEMMLPSTYHDILATQGKFDADQFLQQITTFSFVIGMVGSIFSFLAIAFWAWESDLSIPLSLWIGFALGSQVLIVGLGSLWRGVLIAHDRLVRLRLTLLAGSMFTLLSYALLPNKPAIFLPFIAGITTLISTCLAWQFTRDIFPDIRLQRPQELHPKLRIFAQSLLALGFAAGLVHIQAIIERAALFKLETGMVTAYTVAGRGWEAILAVVVAAAVMPVYPQWAEQSTMSKDQSLLNWSIKRAIGLTAIFTLVVGGVAVFGLSVLHDDSWLSWRQTLELILALLPRFALLVTLQPLILKHYAQGNPYLPVFGSALGTIMIIFGALALIPMFGIWGIVLTTSASVIPGWLLLSWNEWGDDKCVF